MKAIVVAASATMATGLLLLFFAWIAVRVPWEVPDPGAMAQPSVLLDRRGNEIMRFASTVDRRVVDLAAIAPVARNAVVASEDARFFEHTGVDPVSLLRAVVTNVRTGDLRQGGSTLTQQYVKNAFLSPERTVTRKVREAVIAIALERQRSKDEILEAYLNQVYFGEFAWGIEAAARTYFGIPASDLDAAQAATLAQLLPAPSLRNPRVDPEGAKERRAVVLDRMVALGMLSESEAAAAKEQELEILPRVRPEAAANPYFVEYVRRQLVAAYGEEAVLTGALKVTTSLDPAAQAALDQAVADQLPHLDPPFHDVDAGAAAVDPRTGDILAIRGGRSFEESQVDLGTQLTGRQAGSTFKPFVFIAALQQDFLPGDRYDAPARVTPTTCAPLPDGSNPFKAPVANADRRGYGRITLADALSRSVNTVFVQLGCDVAPEAVVDVMSLMGVRNRIAPEPFVSIGAGTTGPSPLDLASAYGTLANDGLACPARSILRVEDAAGNELPLPEEVTVGLGQEPRSRVLSEDELADRPAELAALDQGRCRQVLDADVARTTVQALERVVAETTGRRAAIGRPQAGKTGTTDGPTDAWYAGFTPDLALAVWVGDTNRDGEGGLAELRGILGFRSVQGGTIPALIWRDAAQAILAEVPISDFLEPGELRRNDGPRPAPARPKPEVPAEPSPEPTTEFTETEEPTADPSPTPTADPSDAPSPSPTDPDDDDDGGCFLVFCR